MSTQKIDLSDAKLRSLKPAAPGQRYEIADTRISGFRVRVGDGVVKSGERKGKAAQVSFYLLARFPPSSNPTRRLLGNYSADPEECPGMSLADARVKAGAWKDLIGAGVDPQAKERDEREELERQRQAELEKKLDISFGKVAQDYLNKVVIGPDPKKPLQRNGPDIERAIRREFTSRWRDKPVTEITARDVRVVINEALERGARFRAHSLLTFVTTLFNWAKGEDSPYGLTSNPASTIDRKRAIGDKPSRDRVLTEEEIAAFWAATLTMRYPLGPLYRLLLLTGARLNELAKATWAELDPKLVRMIREAEGEPIDWTAVPAVIKQIVIAGDRIKNGNPFVLPLSSPALEIIAALPRFPRGEYLFTTTGGEKAVNGFSKGKAALDEAMLKALRKATEEAGDDPDAVKLAPFVIHDLRRTVRTGLSRLKVQSEIAELVIGHTQTGLLKVYNHYDYLDEKREALELWGNRVMAIVNPPEPEPKTAKVIDLAARRKDSRIGG